MRIKAKEIVEFIQDDDRLREERKKAKKNRDKYVGIDSEFSSSSSHHRIGGSGGGGGFSDFPKSKTTSFNELDDKEWRTSNPSIQDRITDITSKVKTILEKAPESSIKDNNLEFSDDDRDDTIPDRPAKSNTFSDELTTAKKFPEPKVF